MGRLSLAIGRQKEPGDGRRSRHLRSSIKGFLGIPGSERASVDLGDMDYSSMDDAASQSSMRNLHMHDILAQPPPQAGEAKDAHGAALARAESGFADSRAAHPIINEHRALRGNSSSHNALRAAAAAGNASAHTHAEIAAAQLERNSVSLDRDASDSEKNSWRRRGSMLSSRLTVPLRKDAGAGGSNGAQGRVLVRKESTPQFSAPPRHSAQLTPHPELPDQTKSPFWRGSSTLRIAGSPALSSDAKTAAQLERTHRSSSVPFLTPIPATASTTPQIANASASSGKPAASPYLRAVSSGLGGYNARRTAKGYASTHQDRFPKLALGDDSSTPPGSPNAAMAAAATGDPTPMTFLVSPRARASSSARHIAGHSLSSTPSRDLNLNLSKRTLSSSTIPSLELNAPASPRAMSGGVDMSEFGVVAGATPVLSGVVQSEFGVVVGTTPVSGCTPVSAAFAPLNEAAEDECRAGKAGSAVRHADECCADKADAVHETHHMEVQHDPRTGRKMINQYMIIRELGRGTHGKVKLAFDTIAGEYYAIKVIDKESRGRARRMRPAPAHRSSQRSRGFLRIDLDKMEKVKREIAILKKCHHPNVVRLREVIDDAHARRIYLVIEYMDGGEIAWRDNAHLPVMSADKARCVFRDLVLGVEYLHYAGILHRDLKPQNLLCNRAGTVKISDFGVSFLSRQTHKPRADHPQPGNDVLSTQSSQPLGRSAAFANSHLHHCASQPLMSGPSQPRLADGPMLQHKASALSRGSGKPASLSGSESSSLRIRAPPVRHPLQAQSPCHLQRHITQSVRRQATMGMTDEFGNSNGSHPAPRDGAAESSAETSPGHKLPPEFMSADANVYDPFDSSDSAEFFSSSDEGSDYGSQYEHSSLGESGAANGVEQLKLADDDSGSEDGIVFGVLPSPSKTTEVRASPSRPRRGHQRKGTLGEIEFDYNEKDEERELAKTAGTPAFFAPELCCTSEELAKVLKAHARRQTRVRPDTQHSAARLSAADSEGEASAHARPASLFIESPATDALRGPSKITKRHSALTSLLSRPFSSKGRASTGNSSQFSVPAQGVRHDDADIISDDELDQPLPANPITPAIDIWAMGVTLYCLIYGRVPFKASTEFELFNVIPRRPLEFPQYLEVSEDDDDEDMPSLFGMHGNALDAAERKQPPKRRISLPPLDSDLRDLLTRLLDKDFRTRITIDEIKRHPWVVKDLDRPATWATETDPKSQPSVTITLQEVEQAMVPKVRQRRGFRATVKHRISMFSPLTGKSQRPASHQPMRHGGAKTKSSLDWLKIWQ
ncbi:hypothetical protein GGF43_003138 [Coemansia sp. RSA 2618]|nr:hypothetical protein GGF43_003138 [Coemansia sp. RSA 2618]